MRGFVSDNRCLLYIVPLLILCQKQPSSSATSTSSSSSAVNSEEDSSSRKPLPSSNSTWKVCDGADNPMWANGLTWSHDAILYFLKSKYSGCNYISGHLSIKYLAKNSDIKSNFSYLSTIVEVRGSVYIEIDVAQDIPLTNLRLIRGNWPHKFDGKSYALFVTVKEWSPNSKSLIDLRSLSSITKNDIYINIERGYSKFISKIDWHSMLEFPDQQRFVIKNVAPKNTVEEPCSSQCSVINGKRYCFGPEEQMCQKVDKCDRSKCSGARCFTEPGTGRERCCHRNCFGGCRDISHRTCLACRSYSNGNDCVEQCPAYHIHNLCLKRCPKHYMESDNNCLKRCGSNTFPQWDTCVPCTGSKCAKVCRMDAIVNDLLKKKPNLKKDLLYKRKEAPTLRSMIMKLRNCTTLIGDIIVTAYALTKEDNLDEYLRPQDFQNLKNLRHINGYIYLHLKKYPEIKNLSFLSNLESIRTPISSKGIEIYMSKLEFLGLKNLKNVSVDLVKIFLNKELCYLGRQRTLFPEASRILISPNKGCRSNGKVCDQTCDPLRGCWGPGKSLCALCPQYQAGARCVPRCEKEKGYYTNGSSLQCGRCHETCRKTCSGPDANQCIDSGTD